MHQRSFLVIQNLVFMLVMMREIFLLQTAAGMISIAASYGFVDDLDQIKKWGSDYVINSPLDLKKFITHSA